MIRCRRLTALLLLLFGLACSKGEEQRSSGDSAPEVHRTPSKSVAAVPDAPAPVPARPEVEKTVKPAEPAVVPVSQRPLPTIESLPDPSTIGDSPTGLINGDFAPELDLLDLASGERFQLSRHVGPRAEDPRKAVVVSFTASWCGPCKASLPYLKEMEEKYAPDLAVILVTMDSDRKGRDKELRQLRASGLDAPLLQPDRHTLRAWLGRRRNIPHLYIINAAGEILVQDRGFGKKVRKVLPRQIAYALKHPEYVVRKKKVR